MILLAVLITCCSLVWSWTHMFLNVQIRPKDRTLHNDMCCYTTLPICTTVCFTAQFTPNWVQIRTMIDVKRSWAVSWKGGYVSLSSRAGAEIAPLCRASSLPELLLGSLINTTAAAPLLHSHPPTRRDRAFPGTAHFLTRGRGCRCPQRARWKPIGAPAMITRMLQPPSPSGDLVPEILKAEPSRQSRHSKQSFFQLSQTEQNTITWDALKRSGQTGRPDILQGSTQMSSDDFLCPFCAFEHKATGFRIMSAYICFGWEKQVIELPVPSGGWSNSFT